MPADQTNRGKSISPLDYGQDLENCHLTPQGKEIIGLTHYSVCNIVCVIHCFVLIHRLSVDKKHMRILILAPLLFV